MFFVSSNSSIDIQVTQCCTYMLAKTSTKYATSNLTQVDISNWWPLVSCFVTLLFTISQLLSMIKYFWIFSRILAGNLEKSLVHSLIFISKWFLRHPFRFLVWFLCMQVLHCHFFRSSRPEVFLEKGVLKICSKFTGEHPCRSVISTKLLRTPLNDCFCCFHVIDLKHHKDLTAYLSVY